MAPSPSDNMSASGPVSLALLIVRIATALPLLYHGSAILFGAFGGPGPHGFAAFMKAPDIIGYLVGLAQFGGGIAILTGILIRFGALCNVIVMLGAIIMVHLPHGYDITKGGYEYALTVCLTALALLIAGGGSYSLASVLPGSLRKF